MKLSLTDFKDQAKLVKSNERYDLYDLNMEHLTLSMTVLKPEQETRGHIHEDVEEIYLCLEGEGLIQVGDEKIDFKKDDLVTIPMKNFHKVSNPSKEKLTFLSIFEKYSRDEAEKKIYKEES